jgi:hypothetical protein
VRDEAALSHIAERAQAIAVEVEKCFQRRNVLGGRGRLPVEERGDGDFVAPDGFADLRECYVLFRFGGE